MLVFLQSDNMTTFLRKCPGFSSKKRTKAAKKRTNGTLWNKKEEKKPKNDFLSIKNGQNRGLLENLSVFVYFSTGLSLVQFNHLELLLALLDEKLAVFIEHVNGYLKLSVCNLVSANSQAALLNGS